MNHLPPVTRRSRSVCTAVHTEPQPRSLGAGAQSGGAAHGATPWSKRLALGVLGLGLSSASAGCIIVSNGSDDDGWKDLPPPPPARRTSCSPP